MGKKVEGNEDQRRALARKARAKGRLPSEVGATLGATKQPAHDDRRDHPKHKATDPVEPIPPGSHPPPPRLH